MKRMKVYFVFVLFCLSLWAVPIAAQEGRPVISLYYYSSEERILMCVSGESGKQGVLFITLKDSELHGMEPRRQTFGRPANPALVTFQRVLLGLHTTGTRQPSGENVRLLQETIGTVGQDAADGVWGDETWQRLFGYIHKMTDKQETVDLPLGKYQVRIYRLDVTIQKGEDSDEKNSLQALLRDSSEAVVPAKAFPMKLVEAYNDLINATPAVTPTQHTPPEQSASTQPERTPSEKKGIRWWLWLGWPLFSLIFVVLIVVVLARVGARRPNAEVKEEQREGQGKLALSPPEQVEEVGETLNGIEKEVENVCETGIPMTSQEQPSEVPVLALKDMSHQLEDTEQHLEQCPDESANSLLKATKKQQENQETSEVSATPNGHVSSTPEPDTSRGPDFADTSSPSNEPDTTDMMTLAETVVNPPKKEVEFDLPNIQFWTKATLSLVPEIFPETDGKPAFEYEGEFYPVNQITESDSNGLKKAFVDYVREVLRLAGPDDVELRIEEAGDYQNNARVYDKLLEELFGKNKA